MNNANTEDLNSKIGTLSLALNSVNNELSIARNNMSQLVPFIQGLQALVQSLQGRIAALEATVGMSSDGEAPMDSSNEPATQLHNADSAAAQPVTQQ